MIQEDFEQHVVKLQGALLGFAKSLTHNDDEAKDLWQETALKALVNKEMYRDSGNIKSWLCTIMFNLFLNCRRLSSRQQAMIADFQLDAADDMEEGIDAECAVSATDIQQIMNLLPAKSRELFSLYLQGYHYDEIARRLNMPVGTVKVQIFRIKNRLRACKKQRQNKITPEESQAGRPSDTGRLWRTRMTPTRGFWERCPISLETP